MRTERAVISLVALLGLLGLSSEATASTFAETAPAAPTIRNTNVYAINTSEAVLRGSIDPRDSRTVWHFEVGKTKRYGLGLPGTSFEDPLDGEGFESVEEGISGLHPRTKYHYRIVARNGVGRTVGLDRTFRTK